MGHVQFSFLEKPTTKGSRVLPGWILLLLGLSPALTQPGLGQETIRLDGAPSCDQCRLVVELELSFGGLDAPGVGQHFTVARDSKGRFLAAHSNAPDEVGVFDSSGQFVRTLGRRGEGPGEWMEVRNISAMGDFVYIADVANGRETVLDSDFNVIRSNRLPGDVPELVFLSDSVRVINSLFRSPDLVGFPLHAIDADAKIISSFGYEGEVVRRDFQSAGWRRLSASSDGTVWAAHSRKYVIENWTIEGEKRIAFERQVAWFDSRTGPDRWSPDQPPPPSFGGLWEDPSGLLWAAVFVADPDWKDALTQTEGGGFISLPEEYRDMIVEVINPGSGEVLAESRRVHRRLFSLSPTSSVSPS